ncbi:MAG: hypothetical protein EA389_05880 [Ilumatobacter sp.]|nr:MAG: hypothetical protein EA389_05880 [Ilumatobacter sp.]
MSDVSDPVPDAIDDLERVLGYRDAVDDAGDGGAVDLVGPELVQLPCWTPRFCQALIRAAEAVGGFAPDPDDPVPGHEVSLATISPALFGAVQDDFGRRIWPRLREVWPHIDYHGIRDVFVIRYTLGEQETLRLHHDVAQVSASIKLSDQHEGAELWFPRQRVDNVSQPVGSMLAWPSLVTHPHEVRPLRSGVKYGATVWFELPGDVLMA